MAGIFIEFAQFGDFDSFDIYRSLNIMDESALPTPIVTNLKTMYYVDSSVVEGATYYYMVRVIRGSESVLSDQIKVVANQGDLYWDNVKSLMHFEEATATSNSKDQREIEWTLNGAAVLTASDKKMGSKSLYSPAGATNYLRSEDTDAFNFGSEDKFTLEFFFKKTDASGNACMVGVSGNPGGRWAFFCKSGTNFSLAIYNGASFIDDRSKTFSMDTWYHYAYVKDGTSNKLFVDGTLISSATRATSGYLNSNIFIGQNSVNADSFTGYIDEFRITNGIARYSSDFVPPVQAFFDGR